MNDLQFYNYKRMKTVTSEDNLQGYYFAQRRSAEVIDIGKLYRKIKSIKTALKLAEQHNEDLHTKMKNMKETHHLEILQYETECCKYRQLYQMLTQNYQLRGQELKQCKKRLKKAEMGNVKMVGTHLSLEEAQETTKQHRQTIIKQERELGRLREENRALYEQIYQKGSKIKDYEHVLPKSYSSPSKVDTKDKYFLLSLKTALQTKNQEFDKLVYEKGQLKTVKAVLQKESAEYCIKITKLNAQLELERKNTSELKERLAKHEKQTVKSQQQLKHLTAKYTQLLIFSYELQKDFQKQLHLMGKQLVRKQIIKS